MNKRVVLAHGVFDLVHLGHVRHLETAKKEGDILIVTITPDEFVNKGPGRPVFNANLRSEMLAALQCVDWVGINKWSSSETTLPNDKLRTEEIPIYNSKLDGQPFNLRNVIDFRPYCANTANNGSGTGAALADTAAKATTNPGTTVSFSGEQYWAAIGKNMLADYQVYLPRVDRVVLGKEGAIRVVPGEPDFNPIGPSKQSDAINACDQRLKQLDEKNVFYADDEIGFFFKEVQKIQEALNEFTLK